MKKFTLLLSINLFFITLIKSQNCCNIQKDKMQILALNKDFKMAHLNPIIYKHQSKNDGKMIEFKTPDGKKANAFYLQSKTPSNITILVFQEWWGLNDHIKREAENLFIQIENVNVLALDMYDGKVANTKEEASKLMANVDQTRLQNIVEGASNFAGENAKIASIGWCFGGGLSLKSALWLNKKHIGCVIYYGMPINDLEQLIKINCDILGIFASKETWISPKIVSEFKANMEKLNKNITIKNFDAEHAFANPSNPKFNKEFTEEAWVLTINFLKNKFSELKNFNKL